MAEKNFDNSGALEGMNLEPDSQEHELVVDNSNEDDYYNVENGNENSDSSEASENEDDKDTLKEDENIPDKSIQKKRTKLQKILTIVLTVLIVLLTLGVVLYFMGFFAEEEKPEPKPVVVEKKVAEKKVEFKSRDINTQRLNKKLNNLTKYDDEIIKRKKEEEAKRKALEEEKKRIQEEQKRKEEYEKAQKLIEEQKKLLEQEQKSLEAQKSELLTMKEKLLAEVEEKKAELSELMQEKQSLDNDEPKKTPAHDAGEMPNSNEKEITTDIEDKNGNSFLSFINVAVLKTSLTKSYLKKIERIDTNIYLCRDNKNHIEIYVGPFEMNEHREETLNKFLSNGFKEAMQIDLTQEEFNKRCKY